MIELFYVACGCIGFTCIALWVYTFHIHMRNGLNKVVDEVERQSRLSNLIDS